MGSENLHEAAEALSSETKDTHRAITSLVEELEAIDWYNQRAEACTDADLRAILVHNRDEEGEHAMMMLEWLRRKNPLFEATVRTYLQSTGPITEVEKQMKAEGEGGEAPDASGSPPSLGIGSLKIETSSKG